MAGSRKESKKQTGFYFEDDEKDVLKIGSELINRKETR